MPDAPFPHAGRLSGLSIAITRTQPEGLDLTSPLHAAGAELVPYPCAEILPGPDFERLKSRLRRLVAGEHTWLLLPTADSVVAVGEAFSRIRRGRYGLMSLSIAVFGQATQVAARDILRGAIPLGAESSTARELVAAMRLAPDDNVLLAQSVGAHREWEPLIAATHATIDFVEAYRARMPTDESDLPARLWSGTVDAITFATPIDVRYFAARIKHEGGSLSMLDDVCVACMDQATAVAARAFGLGISLVADQPTPDALVEALATTLA